MRLIRVDDNNKMQGSQNASSCFFAMAYWTRVFPYALPFLFLFVFFFIQALFVFERFAISLRRISVRRYAIQVSGLEPWTTPNMASRRREVRTPTTTDDVHTWGHLKPLTTSHDNIAPFAHEKKWNQLNLSFFNLRKQNNSVTFRWMSGCS